MVESAASQSAPAAVPAGSAAGLATTVARPERGAASLPADGANQTIAASRPEGPSSSAGPADPPPNPGLETSWQLPQWRYASKKARINQRQYRRK
jgi:hypothetical protein